MLTPAPTLGLTLAQLNIDAQAPTPLPGPSPLVRYTVEEPLLLTCLLAGAAVVLWFYFNNRDKPKVAAQAAGVLLLAAGAVYAAGHFITTKRERVLALTKALVRDTAMANIDAVDAHLTPEARLYSPATPDGMSKEAVLNRVRAMLGTGGVARVTDYAVLEAQIDTRTEPVQVQVKVRVTPDGFGPTLSWWRLDAVPSGAGWKVSGIKYLSSNFPIPDFTGSGRGN
jgi:hypothetical protein